MPRPRRLNIAGYPQHLVQRGNNRNRCFQDAVDFRLYLKLLSTACRRHSCDLHSFVLMTNHVHLLLTPRKPDGASMLFRDLGRDYVRKYNSRHGRSGTLWEGRSKSSLIDTDSYLLACYRYIELNPVRAGMVDDPASYEWSSFRVNALGQSNDLITPHALWLTLGEDAAARRRAYIALFEDALTPETVNSIRSGLQMGLPTGSDAFKRFLESTYSVKTDPGKPGRRKSRE